MNWDYYIGQFQDHLRMERSLSENSVTAYVHDVVKLKQFTEISNLNLAATDVKSTQLIGVICRK